jgi:16S rRNA (adenine1518-N6/adenine1519-N6)-dimethyltransferase
MSIIKGFKFKRSLGQNFILDEGFLENLVDELNLKKDMTVVEIGTGAGTLTRVLAGRVKKVITYEMDRRLEEILAKQFRYIENIDLRFEDGMKAKPEIGRYEVVANIPYYITTPLIWKFMADPGCVRICILVQDDVANRIVAKPGGHTYGALSVGIQALADCKIVKRVPRSVFVPVPNVDSAFVVIEKRRGVKIPEAFLKGVFSARRKTMLNALKMDKTVARSVLKKVGIDENLRPEQISVDKYVELSTKLAEILHWNSYYK